MRLHRHGGCESLHTNSRFGCKRKILKNGLTLKEESVIYATSRQSAKARRNCSLTIYQTICVGTQSDMDS
ncbi:hypothetical protein DDJ49_27600 [Klebsiella pneumoniae]|nr:hypothetical protein C6H67_24680 [Klebsiella pneumoniae]RFC02593.1 hypothetical protein DDJ49_27600 [Klebsiella pneumoniae]